MTERQPTHVERTAFMFNFLASKGLISDDLAQEDDIDHQRMIIEDVLQKYEDLSSEYFAGPDRGSQHKRNLGQIGFLRLALEAEDDTALYEYFAAKGWKQDQSVNLLVERSLKSYYQFITNAKSKLVGGEDDPTVDESDSEPSQTLEDTIWDKVDSHTILPAYAGQLLLLLGKLQAPEGTPTPHIDSAKQQAAAHLRHRLNEVEKKSKKKGFSKPDQATQKGMDYLWGLVGLSFNDIKSIDELIESGFVHFDSGIGAEDKKRIVEHYIACAIEVIHTKAL